ncbi:MAG: MiaB/RimO family radical SAM methylthiotransferase, partial [Candidatus Roizmanbacteria bacterium]
MKKTSFYSYSFGCRVNEAEKEEIDRQMIKSGFQFEAEKPDIYIINTCSITQKAEREARQLIYQVKKQFPDTKIVITGCSATYWLKNKLYPDLASDLLVENVNKEFLVKLIKNKLFNQTTPDLQGRESKITFTNKFLGSGRVMIKIQDGCQRFCSYCIVPYLRGTPKSFKTNYLVDKINQLTKTNDIKEVILTAINTEAFGFDTKELFIKLLKDVIDKTHVPRISLGSIHPWSINDDFFKFYQEYSPKKRLVDFFHIPLQSGSNKILNLMKRGYTQKEFVGKLNKLALINPFATIATDIIVAFFEENNADFEDTYNFLEKSPIVKFHIFRYSKRNNTAGFYMAKQLKEPSPKEKTDRAKALIALGKRKYENFLKKNVGRTSSVLILKQKVKGYSQGLLDNQLPIYLPAQPVRLRKVKIIEYKNGRLFGK